MTPQLAKAIEYLTCPRCLGHGTLGHAVNAYYEADRVVGGQRLATTCPTCLGTGMRENRRG